MSDQVNHPTHYQVGGFEVIDVIEGANLCWHRSNALKYVLRSPYKGKEEEDIKKAIWYLTRCTTTCCKNKE